MYLLRPDIVKQHQLKPTFCALGSTADHRLLDMLASLADDTGDHDDDPDTPVLSQVAAQISHLEEQDSILSQMPSAPGSSGGNVEGDKNEDEEEEETLEMSQKVWEGIDDEAESKIEEFPERYNLPLITIFCFQLFIVIVHSHIHNCLALCMSIKLMNSQACSQVLHIPITRNMV